MLTRRVCSICAWREHCQKRYAISADAFLNVNCPDYTRDITIKDRDVENEVVQFQLDRWRREKKPGHGFVITISRQPGAGGSEIARRLAKEFNMLLIGSQIIRRVAESSKMSAKVVETLDEKAVTRIDNMVNSMFAKRHLSPDAYFRHLTRVIATVGEHGDSILVGRGANFIFARKRPVVCASSRRSIWRIQHFMETYHMSHDEARQYVLRRDADQRGFIMQYFKVHIPDPSHYDIVLNTEMLGIEGAYRVISEAFPHWMKPRLQKKQAEIPDLPVGVFSKKNAPVPKKTHP